MKKATKPVTLFCVGGSIYITIEILWRAIRETSPAHWTMFVLGGLCFLLIGAINEYFTWETPLLLQGIVGSVIITSLELITGIILNIWLGLDVWDYSNVPFNFIGQICLPFSVAWILLSIVAVVVDDWLRYWWFGEEQPHYKLF